MDRRGPGLGSGPERGDPSSLRFADADAAFGEARYVLTGLPYDATVSYRAGAADGPRAIRDASHNFEAFNLRNRFDLSRVPIHDAGDLAIRDLAPEKMAEEVERAAKRVVAAGKFPIFLGGEHSTIPPVVRAVAAKHRDLAVLQIDAHLDYRAAYEGTPHNHACAARRIAETVGAGKLALLGLRSAEAAELADAERDGVFFRTAHDIDAAGLGESLQAALAHLGDGPLYVTLDIDAVDPGFAPGTGTPEPFGLHPRDVLRILLRCAPRLVGFDVNEVSPPWDNGATAALAARLVRDVIGEVELAKGGAR